MLIFNIHLQMNQRVENVLIWRGRKQIDMSVKRDASLINRYAFAFAITQFFSTHTHIQNRHTNRDHAH